MRPNSYYSRRNTRLSRQTVSALISAACFAAAAALLLLTAGCGAAWSPVAPTSPNEEFVLARTADAARVLGVDVRGELTDEQYLTTCSDGTQCPAAGWYSRGVARYWRPWVARPESTPDYLTALACHEVSHALEANHNARLAAIEARCIAEVNR